MAYVTPMDEYLFDLRGYLVLKGALSPREVARVNAGIDAIPDLANGEWFGNVEGHTYYGDGEGRNLQNIVEGGEPFEELIDHPAWLPHVTRFVGGDDGLFIDETFANLRGPSEYLPLHSGGDKRRIRTQFRFHNNAFRCGQINILMALTDIHAGDGPTVVIPGSHKANLRHPEFVAGEAANHVAPENVTGAVPVPLDAGDALLFVDTISHGGSQRVNPGLRRIMVYRYGPQWGATRLGYEYSDALIARLTPERARILRPVAKRVPPGYAPTRCGSELT